MRKMESPHSTCPRRVSAQHGLHRSQAHALDDGLVARHVDDAGGLQLSGTAIDQQVDALADAVLDVIRVGQRILVARQDERGTQERHAGR